MSAPPVQRLTIPTRMVLEALLAAPGETYAYDIRRATGLPSGNLSPLLARLEAGGWIASRWESVAEANAAGRPPRKYVQLTAEGMAQACARLDARR